MCTMQDYILFLARVHGPYLFAGSIRGKLSQGEMLKLFLCFRGMEMYFEEYPYQ